MKKFTNQNVLKETKNNDKIIIIGIIILLFGIALGLWGGYEIDKTSENAKSFMPTSSARHPANPLPVLRVPARFSPDTVSALLPAPQSAIPQREPLACP